MLVPVKTIKKTSVSDNRLCLMVFPGVPEVYKANSVHLTSGLCKSADRPMAGRFKNQDSMRFCQHSSFGQMILPISQPHACTSQNEYAIKFQVLQVFEGIHKSREKSGRPTKKSIGRGVGRGCYPPPSVACARLSSLCLVSMFTSQKILWNQLKSTELQKRMSSSQIRIPSYDSKQYNKPTNRTQEVSRRETE